MVIICGLSPILTKGSKLGRRLDRRGGFGLLGVVNCGKATRKCMVDKSCSVRFVIYEKSFSSSWYRRGEHLCKWRFISPLQREMYVLCLLFLHCLQLKIILLPKWHLWGWHILIPFTSNSVMFSSSQVLICTWKGLDDIEIEGETNVERCLENHLL